MSTSISEGLRTKFGSAASLVLLRGDFPLRFSLDEGLVLRSGGISGGGMDEFRVTVFLIERTEGSSSSMSMSDGFLLSDD